MESTMEEKLSQNNEALAKELKQNWRPSKRTKNLMDQYLALQIFDTEWKKICLPGINVIVINTLGLHLNPKSLEPKLAKM